MLTGGLDVVVSRLMCIRRLCIFSSQEMSAFGFCNELCKCFIFSATSLFTRIEFLCRIDSELIARNPLIHDVIGSRRDGCMRHKHVSAIS